MNQRAIELVLSGDHRILLGEDGRLGFQVAGKKEICWQDPIVLFKMFSDRRPDVVYESGSLDHFDPLVDTGTDNHFEPTRGRDTYAGASRETASGATCSPRGARG